MHSNDLDINATKKYFIVKEIEIFQISIEQ